MKAEPERQGLGFSRKQKLGSGENETEREERPIFRRGFEVAPMGNGD